ncbi:MAG TPA: 6-phosphogluconolactonase [Nitrospirae bacterium]|nr:6-phosphogluconolactonase [Nitrospirota bacterium]
MANLVAYMHGRETAGKINIDKKTAVFENASDMSDFVVYKWKEMSRTAIKSKGRFDVALSGGTTPATLYQKLADTDNAIDWDKTHIFIVDERFVPFNNDKSNYKMIRSTLLDNIEIPKQNVHPVPTSGDSPSAAALTYEQDLTSHFDLSQNKLPEFDLILLGIGEDGHTASLFPNSPALDVTEHLTASVSPEDLAKQERITLTFPVINNAKNVFFLVSGTNKAEVIDKIINGNDRSLPAANVNPAIGELFFLLDKDAASLLPDTNNNKEE